MKKLTDDTFAQEVLNSDVPVMVEFGANWCGPCRFLAPIIKEVCNDFEGRAQVFTVDTDESKELVKQYKIQGIPAIFVFHNGEIKSQVIGAVTKGKLVSMLNEVLDEE